MLSLRQFTESDRSDRLAIRLSSQFILWLRSENRYLQPCGLFWLRLQPALAALTLCRLIENHPIRRMSLSDKDLLMYSRASLAGFFGFEDLSRKSWMSHPSADFCDGVTRRSVVQAGLTGIVGLSLPDLLRLQAVASESGSTRDDTAVIYLELAGGPTQHETYDPKPEAPKEYRGPFQSIDTNVPGAQFSELMVEQAKLMDKLAVIHSIHHNSGSHGTSSHLTQTGYYLRDRQNRDNDMPCIGSVTARLRGPNASEMPAFVSIPRTMRYGRASWLGKSFNPFETVRSGNDKKFQVPNLGLLKGFTAERLQDRRKLLAGLDATRKTIDNHGVAEAMDRFTRKAFEMVTGDAARTAFDLSQESDATRSMYGLTAMGQNTLLARRLVERGVTFVSVRMNTAGSWDDHGNIVKRMNQKGPAYDRAVAALVRDLYDRGLDRKILVVAMGEFGRTPRINKNAGRDHWGRLMSVVLSGGGLPVGQVIGSSDRIGSVPKERPYRPENVLAVLYRHLGIDPAHTFVDHSGRPRYLLEKRELIAELV